ncbi:MAG: hypothetical protein ACEY3M_20510 [Wolbachia sp.]
MIANIVRGNLGLPMILKTTNSSFRYVLAAEIPRMNRGITLESCASYSAYLTIR